MPLTNPNKVVTEERLNEYHKTILPYLGGMPDIMANKFSRADLYSTDEKMIGRWIDGKPLYQKTIELTSFNKNDDNNIGLDSSIQIVNSTIISYDNRNYTYPLPLVNASAAAEYYGGYFFTTTNYLGLRVGNYINLTKIIVTVQYTKTIDSSVEIGSDTDYSTTEKIVGTWIDGKPIYQKTVVSTSIDWNNDNDMGLSSLNIDEIVDYNAIAIRTDDYVYGTSIANCAGFTYQFTVFISPTKLVCVRTGTDITQLMDKLRLTIRYTKTN